MTFVRLAALIFLSNVSAAQAQTNGNPREGLRIALAQCAECHRVANERSISPKAAAPSFKRIANVPGMTSRALRTALRTSHKTMPNVIISNNDMADLVAYILTLKDDAR